MAELGFKTLTVENMQQSDPVLSIFVRLSAQDGSIRKLAADEWAREILVVELSEQVPREVRRLFAVARGALVYGYFFYPLYTLGAEQLFRVAEAAVGHKCQDLGVSATKLKSLTFQKQLEYLVKQGTISTTDERRWDALRHLRNLSSHPEDQTILPPGVAIGELRRIAADLDGLFEK
ncbi:MAG: DUF4145 domain-containing protein [Thermomicrobiales bacterium]